MHKACKFKEEWHIECREEIYLLPTFLLGHKNNLSRSLHEASKPFCALLDKCSSPTNRNVNSEHNKQPGRLCMNTDCIDSLDIYKDGFEESLVRYRGWLNDVLLNRHHSDLGDLPTSSPSPQLNDQETGGNGTRETEDASEDEDISYDALETPDTSEDEGWVDLDAQDAGLPVDASAEPDVRLVDPLLDQQARIGHATKQLKCLHSRHTSRLWRFGRSFARLRTLNRRNLRSHPRGPPRNHRRQPNLGLSRKYTCRRRRRANPQCSSSTIHRPRKFPKARLPYSRILMTRGRQRRPKAR